MWARVVELMLACWLAISPFIFRHPPTDLFLWVNDLATATVVAFLSLLSFRRASEKAHLGTIAIGVWLVVFAFLQPHVPLPAAAQNYVVVGLLLLMTAILPSFSEVPPARWRAFYRDDEAGAREHEAGELPSSPVASAQSGTAGSGGAQHAERSADQPPPRQ